MRDNFEHWLTTGIDQTALCTNLFFNKLVSIKIQRIVIGHFHELPHHRLDPTRR